MECDRRYSARSLRVSPAGSVSLLFLNIYAEQDHMIPPASSLALKTYIASEDYTLRSFPVGHIGMYVSSKVQRNLPPTIVDWLNPLLSLWEIKNENQIFNCRFIKDLSIYLPTEWPKSRFLVKVLCYNHPRLFSAESDKRELRCELRKTYAGVLPHHDPFVCCDRPLRRV